MPRNILAQCDTPFLALLVFDWGEPEDYAAFLPYMPATPGVPGSAATRLDAHLDCERIRHGLGD